MVRTGEILLHIQSLQAERAFHAQIWDAYSERYARKEPALAVEDPLNAEKWYHGARPSMERVRAIDAQIQRLFQELDRVDAAGREWSVPTAPVIDQPGEERFDFLQHLKEQAEWSGMTFGPGTRTRGLCDHISKELKEIEKAAAVARFFSTDSRFVEEDRAGLLEEWIDIVILGLDGAWRTGSSPQQIIDALVAKTKKNHAREVARLAADPNKAIEHDRTVDSKCDHYAGQSGDAEPERRSGKDRRRHSVRVMHELRSGNDRRKS